MRALLRVLCVASLVGWAAAAAAQEKPEFKFEFHGFAGGSIYAQDAITGPTNGWGGQAWFVTQTPNEKRVFYGGDVRQTRLTFSLAGPKVFGGATPKALAEFDLFGGPQVGGPAAVNGAFGWTSISPRLRIAWAEMNWGDLVVRFGQDHDLVLGIIVPTSVGHVTNPLSYSSGQVGFRHAGITGFYTAAVDPAFKLELSLQVTRSHWLDNVGDPIGGASALGFGESQNLPALQARVKVIHKMFQAFVAGYWARVHPAGLNQGSGEFGGIDGTGSANARAPLDFDVTAATFGFRVTTSGFTAHGTAYVGNNTGGPILGNAVQIQNPTNPAQVGNGLYATNVHGYGGWLQLGYDITKEFSAWVLAGTDHPNYAEVIGTFGAGGRLQNTVTSGMLRYMEGGYAIGLEYAHWLTKYNGNSATIAGANFAPVSAVRSPNGVLEGNQLMLSGLYFF